MSRIFLICLYFGVAYSNPYGGYPCGYGCDNYGWQNWYGSNCGYGGYSGYPCGPIDSGVQGGVVPSGALPGVVPGVDECPKIAKCSELGFSNFTDCTKTDDCLRSEVCCQNPCASKKQCLIKPKTARTEEDMLVDNLQCPVTDSCKKLNEDYTTWKECQIDNDCKRKEKCCGHPCDDNAVHGLPEKICMDGIALAPTFTMGQNVNFMF